MSAHNIRYFVSTEHPEQLDVRRVLFAAASDVHRRVCKLAGRTGVVSHKVLTALVEELLAVADASRMHMQVGGADGVRAPIIPPPLAKQHGLPANERWPRTATQERCAAQLAEAHARLGDMLRASSALHATFDKYFARSNTDSLRTSDFRLPSKQLTEKRIHQ